MKLTQRTVDALALPAGRSDAIFWDEEMPGFGFRLRQGADGRLGRTWVVQYRADTVSRRMTLGSAEVLKAGQARDKAKETLAQVTLGKDPQGEKQKQRAEDPHTLTATVSAYLAEAKRKVRATTLREKTRYLQDALYFGPLFKMSLDAISRKDVASRLTKITEKSGPIVAARARSQLSTLFGWAMAKGLCERNPVIGTVTHEAPAGERVLSDSEIAAVWNACRDDDYGRVIKLLILSGCRRKEIGGMCFSEIRDGVWTLPASRSKNHRAHSLPVLPMMQTIIDTVPKMASRDTLFGVRGGGFTGWSEGKTALDARLGAMAMEGWVVHDLRRTVASGMADLDVLPHVIEAVLNHQSGHKAGPAGIYNRSKYVNQTRVALETWHDHVRSLVEGTERKVVYLPRDAS